jgi:exodeoxyribonuclease VII large subunit
MFNQVCRNHVFKKAIFHISDVRQQYDTYQERQLRAMGSLFSMVRMQSEKTAARLNALSPLAVMSRGYSVVTDQGGHTIKDARQVKTNDDVTIRFSIGKASAMITSKK